MTKLFEQIVLIADIPNKNNNVYCRKVLEKIVNEFKPSSFGIIGMREDSLIPLSSVSHVVNNLKLVDNELKADITTVDTEEGKRLDIMIKNDMVAFRTAGNCTYKYENGIRIINDDYKLISINAVNINDAA